MAVSLRFFLFAFLIFSVSLFLLPSENPIQAVFIIFSMTVYVLGLQKLETEESHDSTAKWVPWFLILLVMAITVIRPIYFPSYSTDFFRYFWDSLLYARGVNPFETTPANAKTYFNDMEYLYEFLNSKNYFSFYPPTSQSFFQLVFYVPSMLKSVEEFVVRYQIFSTMMLMTAGFCYALWLRKENNEVNFAWVLALMMSPFFLLQGVFEIHTDFLAAFLILLTCLFYSVRIFSLAGALFALAVWCKLHPIILLPFFLFSNQEKIFSAKNLSFLTGFVLLTLLIWNPFAEGFSTAGFIQSISLFFRGFEYNSFLYAGLIQISDFLNWHWLKLHTGLFLLILFLSTCIILVLKSLEYENLQNRLLFALYTYLFMMLFSSTVYMWYFIVPLMLAFLVQRIPLSLIAWIVFSTVTLTWYKKDYSVNFYWMFRIAEYTFITGLLVYDLKYHLSKLILKRNEAETVESVSLPEANQSMMEN